MDECRRKVWCDICLLNEQSNPAAIWCPECFQGLCEGCDLQHSVSRSSDFHTTITINEYLTLPDTVTDVKLFCFEHDKSLELFCPRHREACCISCLGVDHRFCAGVTPIPDVVKHQDIENTTLEYEKNVENMRNHLQKSKQERLKSVVKFKESIDVYRVEMSKFKCKMNEYFDKTVEDSLEKLNTELKTYSRDMKKVNLFMAGLEKNVQEMKEKIENTKKNATALQIFHTYKDIEAEVLELENTVIDSQTDVVLKQIDVRSVTDSSYDYRFNQLDLKDMVNIKKETGRKYVRLDENSNEAQAVGAQGDSTGKVREVSTILPPSISHIKLQKLKTMEFHGYGTCDIVGCSINTKGQLLFCDIGNNRILLFNKDYDYSSVVARSGTPFSAIFVSDDKIAISHKEEKKIKIVGYPCSFENKIPDIELDEVCAGIACSKTRIYGRSMDNIITLDFNGENQEKLNFGVYNPYHLVVLGNTIVTSDGNTVFWLEQDGTELRQSEVPDIDEIRGITVDTYGNVYVSGYGTDNILVISQNGDECRLLLDRDDGLDYPTALAYDKKRDRLIAVTSSGENARAVVYSVVRGK